ncbi:hypothetical protein EDC01DRAFT_478418 [Geopyxis carbonaria]|nr:hypothetical protein EDC01DRAFT_478418 [Geopyxis carbonaria]
MWLAFWIFGSRVLISGFQCSQALGWHCSIGSYIHFIFSTSLATSAHNHDHLPSLPPPAPPITTTPSAPVLQATYTPTMGRGRKGKNRQKNNRAEVVPLTPEQRAEQFEAIPHAEHQKALLYDLKMFLDRYVLDADGRVCPVKATPDRSLVFKALPEATRSALAAAVAELPGLHMKELISPKEENSCGNFWEEVFEPLCGIGTGRGELVRALRHALVDNPKNEIKHAQFVEAGQVPGARPEEDARGRWFLRCETLERRWTVWCEAPVGLRMIIDWDQERQPAQEGVGEQPLLAEFHLGPIGGLMRFWRDGESYDTYTSRPDSDDEDELESEPDDEPHSLEPLKPRIPATPTDPRKLHFHWRGVMPWTGGGDDDHYAHDFARNTGVLVFDETFTSFRGLFHARHTYLGEDFQLRGYKLESGDAVADPDGRPCRAEWKVYTENQDRYIYPSRGGIPLLFH